MLRMSVWKHLTATVKSLLSEVVVLNFLSLSEKLVVSRWLLVVRFHPLQKDFLAEAHLTVTSAESWL